MKTAIAIISQKFSGKSATGDSLAIRLFEPRWMAPGF
jgi:hypothetical protein